MAAGAVGLAIQGGAAGATPVRVSLFPAFAGVEEATGALRVGVGGPRCRVRRDHAPPVGVSRLRLPTSVEKCGVGDGGG